MKKFFVATFYHGYLNKLENTIKKRSEFRDIEIWYPYTSKVVIKDHKWQKVLTPMFDNYVLFYFEENSLIWKDIIRLTPIMNFLKCSESNMPIPLSEDEVERIKFLELKEKTIEYKNLIGKNVIITHGPFAGFNGYCKCLIKNKNSARIIIDMFDIASKSIEISLEYIKPI